jgi:hypothetical protein
MANWRKGGEFVPNQGSLTKEKDDMYAWIMRRRKPLAPALDFATNTETSSVSESEVEPEGLLAGQTAIKSEPQPSKKNGLPYQPPPGWPSSTPPELSEGEKKKSICMSFVDPKEEFPRASPLQIQKKIFSDRLNEQVSKRERILQLKALRGVHSGSYTTVQKDGRWKNEEIDEILRILGKYCPKPWIDWTQGRLVLKGGTWDRELFKLIIKSNFDIYHCVLALEIPAGFLDMMGSDYEKLAKFKRRLRTSQ